MHANAQLALVPARCAATRLSAHQLSAYGSQIGAGDAIGRGWLIGGGSGHPLSPPGARILPNSAPPPPDFLFWQLFDIFLQKRQCILTANCPKQKVGGRCTSERTEFLISFRAPGGATSAHVTVRLGAMPRAQTLAASHAAHDRCQRRLCEAANVRARGMAPSRTVTCAPFAPPGARNEIKNTVRSDVHRPPTFCFGQLIF